MSGCGLPWNRRVAQSLIAGVGLVLVMSAQNSTAKQKADGDGAAAVAAAERGRKQFEQSCGFCHGADATGARGPDLVRSPLVAHDVKGEQIGFLLPTRGGAIAFRPVLDDFGNRTLSILDELDDVAFHAEAVFRHRDQGNLSHPARIDHQAVPFQSDQDA